MNSRLAIVILLIFGHALLNAQEKLSLPLSNSRVEQATMLQLKSSEQNDTLELPFIDDFSRTRIFPDNTLWNENLVFINTNYPINPNSVGVATFDALDASGKLYDRASSLSFQADSLTSAPINLEGKSDVYLSFMYQPQGYGDTPEEKDSLILEFWAPELKTWTEVWAKQGSSTHEFKSVIIPVSNDIFLKKGFRLKFKNLASISSNSSVPSVISNCDHWHIDYVVLDENRSANDTIINDVAFTTETSSLLNNYESVPWEHFQFAVGFEMNNVLPVEYKNNSSETWNISRFFELADVFGNENTYYFRGGERNIAPGETQTYERSINYEFTSNTVDSAKFEIISYLSTDKTGIREDYRWNDTIRFYQNFYNYYAYDDGSAENGYGLTGGSTSTGKVAYRFFSYRKDTLRGVQMYFNSTYNNANNQGFYITVWEDNNGVPGEIIYQSESTQTPIQSDSLNKFVSYVITDTAFAVNGDFYVGWQQTGTSLLNVGFDRNRDASEHLFYNIDGNWRNTSFEGALMLRPILGKSITSVPASTKIVEESRFTLYPNPVREVLYIKGNKQYHTLFIRILNSQGQLVKQSQVNNSMDVRELEPGIYFIQITGETGKPNTARFIKAN